MPGSDYTSSSSTGLVIPAGQTTATFDVPLLGDTVVEGNETFTVNVSNAVGATISDGQAIGRINNDDTAVLSIADASIMEGASGQSTISFQIRLSNPQPNPVTFDIATGNGTAQSGSDYVARSQVGRFLDAGRSSQIFEVQVVGDATVEANETLQVAISNVVGATLGDGNAVGTILNDDAAAAPQSASASGALAPAKGSLRRPSAKAKTGSGR
jgi:chitinase